MERNILLTASVFGAVGVLAGAFGAHGLKDELGTTDMYIYETAVRYQMLHALALLGLGTAWSKLDKVWARGSFHAFWLGIAFFSGSLYLLSTRELTGWSFAWLWPVTPMGGLLMVAGWMLIGVAAFKYNAGKE